MKGKQSGNGLKGIEKHIVTELLLSFPKKSGKAEKWP